MYYIYLSTYAIPTYRVYWLYDNVYVYRVKNNLTQLTICKHDKINNVCNEIDTIMNEFTMMKYDCSVYIDDKCMMFPLR